MSDDKIIRFPGAQQQQQEAPVGADRQKALGIISSGMPFICIGIKETDGGADFFTALHGDQTALRNAYDHLPGVLQRLYERRGIL